jgi:hypothetical protein
MSETEYNLSRTGEADGDDAKESALAGETYRCYSQAE